MAVSVAPDGTCEVQYVDREKVARVLSLMKPERTFRDLAETFKILGDSTRIKLLFALSEQPLALLQPPPHNAKVHIVRILHERPPEREGPGASSPALSF